MFEGRPASSTGGHDGAERLLTRQSFVLGAAAAAAGVAGCGGSSSSVGRTVAVGCAAASVTAGAATPLWQTAMKQGIVYGSSAATWQLSDRTYRRLFQRESGILFTEDDLLWWRLRPTPESDLDFTYGDRIIGFAERNGMLVLGAHLVWDEGYGDGWQEGDLSGLDEAAARDLLLGTVKDVVTRYRGRVAAWVVANEVLDGSGMRIDTPWYETIGPSYVADAFRAAHEADPDATLLLNDYGYETDDEYETAADRRSAVVTFLDALLDDDVPVHALGVQAHLHADDFANRFDAEAYREFLSEVADRDLKILVTELDVLDDGLPAAVAARDAAVADAYRTYLDVALEAPALAAVVNFGLSDRYTWLQEDYPREDGAARRPLPFDEKLRRKPAHDAVQTSLSGAPAREPPWRPPLC